MGTDLLDDLCTAVIEGDEAEAASAAQLALCEGIAPSDVLAAVNRAADEIGRQYECGEFFLPELLAGADAMIKAVDLVLPELERGRIGPKGIIVIGTVEGDIHDIGKRIVSGMLAGAGFRIHDLGTNVPASKFVEEAREVNANIVAASACFSTTTIRLPEIEEALCEAGIREKVIYIVGGAAVSRTMVDWAKADGYGQDAAEAVRVVSSLIEGKEHS